MSSQILPPDGESQNPADKEQYSVNQHFTLRRPFAIAARSYTQAELPVFPLARMSNVPLKGSRGFKDATTDPDEINRMIEKTPAANVGLATGHVSGVLLIDVDPDKGGEGTLTELEAQIGPLPKTRTHRTPRDGRHHLYRLPKDAGPVKCSARDGLDVRGDGGYAVMPPSVRPQGEYTVKNRVPMAEAPAALIEWARNRTGGSRRSDGHTRKAAVPPEGEPVHEGSRNDTLKWRCYWWHQDGLSKEDVAARALALNEKWFRPALPEGEVLDTARSMCRYPIRRREALPEVREVLDAWGRRWWEEMVPGGGRSKVRDCARVLMESGDRWGKLVEVIVGGEVRRAVAVSASARQGAVPAATSHMSFARAMRRLEELGAILPGNENPEPGHSATWLIIAPATKRYTHAVPPLAGGVTPRRAPELATPCYRWRGHVGNAKAGALYVLEGYGPQTAEELAERLGWSRVRDLRYRYLEPLMELGLIAESDGVYSLAEGYGERTEEIRKAPYTTVTRRRRERQDGDRTVKWVEEIERTESEVERADADRERYAEQTRRFREALENKRRRGPVPDVSNSPEDMVEVPKNLADPVEELRRAGWVPDSRLGDDLWAHTSTGEVAGRDAALAAARKEAS